MGWVLQGRRRHQRCNRYLTCPELSPTRMPPGHYRPQLPGSLPQSLAAMALAFSCYMLVNMVYSGLKMAACTRCACLPVYLYSSALRRHGGWWHMRGGCFGLQTALGAPLPALPTTSQCVRACLLAWPSKAAEHPHNSGACPPLPLARSVGNGLGAGSAAAAKLSARAAVCTTLPIWTAQVVLLLLPQSQLALISLFTSDATDPGEVLRGAGRDGGLAGESAPPWPPCDVPGRCWTAAS